MGGPWAVDPSQLELCHFGLRGGCRTERYTSMSVPRFAHPANAVPSPDCLFTGADLPMPRVVILSDGTRLKLRALKPPGGESIIHMGVRSVLSEYTMLIRWRLWVGHCRHVHGRHSGLLCGLSG
jgi:hypothetical protein